MLVQVEKPYSDFIHKIISLGFAKNPDEVIRQSLLIYQNQIEYEELFLVDKAVNTELENLNKDRGKLFSIEEVFSEAGI